MVAEISINSRVDWFITFDDIEIFEHWEFR